MAKKSSSNKSSSRSGKTYYSHHVSYGSNGRPSSVTTTNKSTGQTTTKKVGSGGGGSRSGTSGSSSSSSSNVSYKYNPTTGYYERTGGGTDTYGHTTVGNGKVSTDYASKYSNNSTYNSMVSKYGADAVHKALDYTSSGGKDSNQLKNILSGGNTDTSTAGVGNALSKMTFGSGAGNASAQSTRNQQIANLLKQSGVKYDNSQSVRELLEKYSPGYASASDEDKDATASRIFGMYTGGYDEVDNDSPINGESDFEDTNEQGNVDYDELLGEVGLGEQDIIDENNLGEEEPEEEPEEDERDRKIRELEDELYDYRNNEYNQLESAVNDTFSNKEEEKTTGLTDEQKEANAEASSFAWNRAQENANSTVPEKTTPEEKQEGLADVTSYQDRQTKMDNAIERLGYKLENAPSPESENELVENAMEGKQPENTVDEQQQIAESNATNGEATPEFNDENTLVNSYEEAFQNMLNNQDINKDDIIKTYLGAKDAAALYAVRNGLTDVAYNNILNRIKHSPSLKSLLQQYKQGQTNM